MVLVRFEGLDSSKEPETSKLTNLNSSAVHFRFDGNSLVYNMYLRVFAEMLASPAVQFGSYVFFWNPTADRGGAGAEGLFLGIGCDWIVIFMVYHNQQSAEFSECATITIYNQLLPWYMSCCWQYRMKLLLLTFISTLTGDGRTPIHCRRRHDEKVRKVHRHELYHYWWSLW